MTDVWESEGGYTPPLPETPWFFYNGFGQRSNDSRIKISPNSQIVWLRTPDGDEWAGISFEAVHMMSEYLRSERYVRDCQANLPYVHDEG